MSRYHRYQHTKKRRVLVLKKQAKYKLVDRLTFIAAIVEPAVTIPQVIDILRTHNAAGISLSTWIGYDLLTIIWLWYAIVHKEKMVFIYSALYIVVITAVILSGFIYGAKW